MNTDIEDFINTKNKLGVDDYNNFNSSAWDINGCKKIFINLLIWLNQNLMMLDNLMVIILL